MCLILIGYRTTPDYPLIIAANRDEFHGRASSSAGFWHDHEQVLAGRDLVAGGTWLGCTRDGRFAALTNFPNANTGSEESTPPCSRGLLVQGFLTGNDSAQHYAHHVHGPDYAGYNLLLFDGDELVCTSNNGTTDTLHPGFYGLSNAEFGAQWPKCVNGAQGLQHIFESSSTSEAEAYHTDLIHLLNNCDIPNDEQLPHRGRPIEFERRVAPCFIVGDEYGTRASTSVILSHDRLRFAEQSYASGGVATELVEFDLKLKR